MIKAITFNEARNTLKKLINRETDAKRIFTRT